jgi:uncharacterized membrane protein YkvA (DUF1232 family)
MMGIFSRIIDWLTTPYTIYLVLKDPAISRPIKLRTSIVLVVLFAYIISPLDIIPDFIPFSGWLDDLIVVPLAMILVRKITPGFDIVEKQNFAQKRIKRALFWTLAFIIAAILLGLLWFGLIIFLIVKLITG